MAEPDRPELDHVLFGVARDLIVRGDSPHLPRGWDRLRRQIRPGRRSFFTARASSERLTTDALDWWKSFAEGRIDVTEYLTDLVERATGYLPSRATGYQPSPAAAVSHLTPVAHGLVAEHLEQQAFLVSPDWPTYLVNIWLIATRLTEPEIRRAHETATELDLSSALHRLPRADGGVVVQQHRGRRCPEASVAAARQHHCIWPQLCWLTQCILHYQADRKERRRIAAREGRPLEPTPHACIGSRGSELPPTLPLTYFEWEVRPLFYPRDAHDRTERAGVSVALERGDLIGPFALITQFPLDSPYPFQRRQCLRPDQLTEAVINWDSGFESLTSARLRHTRPDSNPLGHRVEVNPCEHWGRLADLTASPSHRWAGTCHRVYPRWLDDAADPNRWEGTHYRVWPRASIHRRPDDLEAPIRLRDITADILASEPPRQAFNILLSAFGEPDIADRILTLTADLNHIQRREDRRRRRQAR